MCWRTQEGVFHPLKNFLFLPFISATLLCILQFLRDPGLWCLKPPPRTRWDLNEEGCQGPPVLPWVDRQGQHSHPSFAVSPELHLRPTASLLWAVGVCW